MQYSPVSWFFAQLPIPDSCPFPGAVPFRFLQIYVKSAMYLHVLLRPAADKGMHAGAHPVWKPINDNETNVQTASAGAEKKECSIFGSSGQARMW